MLSGGPMAFTALLRVLASAQMEAGARIETRVGEVPAGTDSQQTEVMILATPNLRMHWLAGASDLHADLASRILWLPVPLLHSRPLFWETVGVTHTAQTSLRTYRRLSLRASYGEQNYTSLSQEMANQPTLPLSSTMLMINGAADVLWRSSRRTTLMFRLEAAHRRSWEGWTGASPSPSESPWILPTQTTVSANPVLRLLKSRLTTLDLSMTVNDCDVKGGGIGLSRGEPVNVFWATPQAILRERINRRQQLTLSAGLAYARILRGSSTSLGRHLTPLALVGLDSMVFRVRSSAVRSFVNAGTTWFVDPVLSRGVWRGIAQLGFDVQAGSRWSAGSHFSFTTDLARPPVTNATVDGTIDGTIAAADVSLRYRWTDLFIGELGGRFTERGPRLSSADFVWRGRELWAYFTVYTTTSVPLTGLRSTQD